MLRAIAPFLCHGFFPEPAGSEINRRLEAMFFISGFSRFSKSCERGMEKPFSLAVEKSMPTSAPARNL